MTERVKKKALPQRRQPARGVHIRLGEPNIVFVTVCSKDREPWLTGHAVHDALISVWRDASAWQIGNYVIMPDHVHLFCAPMDLRSTLRGWVKYWKGQFTKLDVPGAGGWQRGCWDTRLRRGESYTEKWHYVRNNPVRKKLASHADDWPFQGQLNVLRW